MGLNRETAKRAEGWGWYTSYGSTAEDVLDYVSADLHHIENDPPWPGFDGKTFKVTVIVEEQ